MSSDDGHGRQVSHAEIEELVEDFRELRNMNDVENPTVHQATKHAVWGTAADLLEELIEDG